MPDPARRKPTSTARCYCTHAVSRHPLGVLSQEDPRPCRVRACGCRNLRPASPLLFMPEKELDRRIQKIIKDDLAVWVWSYHTWNSQHSQSGWPDRVYLRRVPGSNGGRSMFRELKRHGEDPTDTQRECLELLRAAGHDADVWGPEDLLSGRVARELAALAGMRVAA